MEAPWVHASELEPPLLQAAMRSATIEAYGTKVFIGALGGFSPGSAYATTRQRLPFGKGAGAPRVERPARGPAPSIVGVDDVSACPILVRPTTEVVAGRGAASKRSRAKLDARGYLVATRRLIDFVDSLASRNVE